jgi:hypothetical protein
MVLVFLNGVSVVAAFHLQYDEGKLCLWMFFLSD